MPQLRYYNPANPRQQYQTGIVNDPNIPAGWLDTQGSDGATPERLQQYMAGVNNQGAGGPNVTDGDPQQRIDQPTWPNGILGGFTGGSATQPSKWP